MERVDKILKNKMIMALDSAAFLASVFLLSRRARQGSKNYQTRARLLSTRCYSQIELAFTLMRKRVRANGMRR